MRKVKTAIRCWTVSSLLLLEGPDWLPQSSKGFCKHFFFFFFSWALQVLAYCSFEKTTPPRPHPAHPFPLTPPGQQIVKGPELGWHNSPLMTLLAVICGWKSTGNMIMRPVIGQDKLEISQ